jgi:outer membrane protein OmpA-like peptidoglycan-associated protein
MAPAGLALCLAIGGTGASADDRRGGEVGILAGALAPDDALTLDDSSVEPFLGLRGGSVFTRRWGWYIDAWYAELDTLHTRLSPTGPGAPLGTARTVTGRTGIDWLFTPERDVRWFVTAGAAWTKVDFEHGGPEDFHRPAASVGGGQRLRIGHNLRFRWEVRVDHTLDDNGINNEDMTHGLLVAGLTFGPSGAPSGARVAAEPGAPPTRTTRVPAGDSDGDGRANSRDDCPDTPLGALVDDRGCPVDGDGDRVPDGIDRCPYTRRNHAVGPDGCPADSDGDGVADPADACPSTPPSSVVDDWGCPRDADRDGVPDGIDRCARTGSGIAVDEHGCASDSDADGVPDSADRCPGTPAGAIVDRAGCPEAADGDRDGVPDPADRCPSTPAGSDVDATGCPVAADRDVDRDGIADRADRCPGTPRGVPVDDAGCPDEPPSIFGDRDRPLVVPDLVFAAGSAALPPGGRDVLDRMAAALTDAPPDVRVEIGGHTDDAGDAADNLDLSQRRAEAVRAYLISVGVPAERLVARGYGESRPVADNATVEGRARNRRIEIRQIHP